VQEVGKVTVFDGHRRKLRIARRADASRVAKKMEHGAVEKFIRLIPKRFLSR